MSLRTNGRPKRAAGKHAVAGYGFAIISTLFVLLLRWRLWPLLGDTSPFVLFFLSVLITTRYFGSGPGTLATLLGAATGFFFFTAPRYTFILGEAKDMVRLVLFLVVATGTVWMSWLRERSEAALHRSTEKLEYLLEIARDLLLTDQPARYVETLYRRIAVILGLDLYLFYMTCGDGETLCLESHAGLPDAGLPDAGLPQAGKVSAEQERTDGVSGGRQRVLVSSAESRDSHAAFVRSLGATAYAVYPLIAHEHLVGSLAFGARGRRPFDRDELALMQTVCDQVAIAVDRARLIAALRERAEELAEGDRHKNEFLAMLAHELRNPLAPIRTAVAVMRLRSADREALERNQGVLDRQLLHMSRLLDDLLDMSRISRGKIRLRKERLELGPILDGAVEACRPLITQRRHELRVTPPGPVWVDADATRLQQVLTNLLTNAAKYTDPAGHIELCARGEGEEVIISVTDDGIGISPEMLPRVFDLFSQAARALNRAEGGLGIGLNLVRALVEMHGGSVAAASDGAGAGSRFTVRLPLAPAPAPLESAGPQSDRASFPRKPAAPLAAARSPRVLVVDDNADAAETLSELLELWGFEPVVAHDGEAGLRLVESTHPQMALLDVGLPGMDGYEVARRIRGGLGGDEMLLVALTGYGQEEDRQRSRDAGIDCHLTKPVEVDYLRELLLRHAAPRDALVE